MARAHSFVPVFRGALPRPRPLRSPQYLTRLARCLAALEAVAGGTPGARARLKRAAAGRGEARRFLRRFEGSWDDGDENLVRGLLDLWVRPEEDGLVTGARSLVAAAGELARIQARPETLLFFAWEMESMLAEMSRPGGPTSLADKARRPC